MKELKPGDKIVRLTDYHDNLRYSLSKGQICTVFKSVGQGVQLVGEHHDYVYDAREFKLYEAENTDEPNMKYDAGKTPYALFAFNALEEVGKVYAMGAEKYSPDGWRSNGGMGYRRLISAGCRHFFAWIRGEDTDPESGLSHLAHAAWNILALLEYHLTENGIDDRWKGNNEG